MRTFEKIVMGFFTVTYYYLFIKAINFLYPGFLSLSSISFASVMTLIILVAPSLLVAYATIKYITR